MKMWAAIINLCLAPLLINGQLPPVAPINLEQFIENRFGLPQQNIPYEDLYETLVLYYSQPLNLNQATSSQLESLQLLSPLQVQSFIRYRSMFGNFLSLYELQAIPGFSLKIIEELLPFVTLPANSLAQDNSRNLAELASRANRYAIFRYERVLEERRGYLPKSDSMPAPYAGSPDKLYFRLRISHTQDYSVGFTAEKDAGEAFGFSQKRKSLGADFYSFHAMLYNRGRIKRAVVGDYQVQWGQGLVSGAGFYLGKGSETIAGTMQASTGLRPYTSVIENGFFRGAAFTYALSPTLEITALGSRLANDAGGIADTANNQSDAIITAIRSSGLHRTISEIQGKQAVVESNVGTELKYTSPNQKAQFGVTNLFTSLNQNLRLKPNLYNQYYFNGSRHYAGSLYGRYYLPGSSVFSELAYSTNGGIGLVSGLVSSLSRQLDYSVLFRHYSVRYHSFYGVAFSEGSRLQNETGFYLGLQYTLEKRWRLSTYLDRFWFPVARYGAYAPTQGFEILARLDYKPSKELHLFTQVRSQTREKNLPETRLYSIDEALKQQAVFNLDYQLSDAVKLRSRWQGSWYKFNSQSSYGNVLWQDVDVKRGLWSAAARLALFQTDDYENRQYAFERDVLWAFSVPAYYGRGMRYYILVKYKVSKNLSLWGRWARTQYRDRQHISSGNETIVGNTISQVKFQLKYDF